jgi:hypothetical protein
MTDAEILEKIKQQPISRLDIDIYDNIKTIGEYKYLDFSQLSVERNTIQTIISFYCKKPVKKIFIEAPTTHYLVGAAKDNNQLLRLCGCHVDESVLNKDQLKLLPLEESQLKVSAWYGDVEAKMDGVLDNLSSDLMRFESPAVDRYNQLVTQQTAQLQALLPAVPAESSVTP